MLKYHIPNIDKHAIPRVFLVFESLFFPDNYLANAKIMVCLKTKQFEKIMRQNTIHNAYTYISNCMFFLRVLTNAWCIRFKDSVFKSIVLVLHQRAVS